MPDEKDIDDKYQPRWRLYTFTNYYMSPLQKGIQSLHVACDMLSLYSRAGEWSNEKREMAEHWAREHKTVIVLNGGNSRQLREIYKELIQKYVYPTMMFAEDEQSLNNAVTCVGTIVPEQVYLMAKYIRENPSSGWTPELEGLYTTRPYSLFVEEDQRMRWFDVTAADLLIATVISGYSLAT